jgi:hypothetical protein
MTRIHITYAKEYAYKVMFSTVSPFTTSGKQHVVDMQATHVVAVFFRKFSWWRLFRTLAPWISHFGLGLTIHRHGALTWCLKIYVMQGAIGRLIAPRVLTGRQKDFRAEASFMVTWPTATLTCSEEPCMPFL